jgi:PAS domain S-box-containing protein
MDFLAPGSREPRPVHLPGSPDPQAFLAAFVAAAADAVVGIARDGTVLSWNPAAERIFGYRASDIVGQPFARLVPPDLLPELDDIAARVLAGHPVTCDTVRLARDGRPVPVRLMSAPVRDGEGRIVGRAATLTDITDRLRAEAERRATEERLTLALEGAEDGYWDWDLETGESFLSPRWYRLLGYEPGALPAHADTWQRLLHPDDRPGVWARLQAHLAGEVPQYEAEQRMRHRDGHWVWVLARGKVVERLPGENGRPGPPRRMVGTMLDISARKAVELAMREREADQRFLVDLSVALQATTDPEALGAIALARIAEHFGAAVCGWTTHAPGGDSFTIQQEYRDGTVVRVGQVVPMTAWPRRSRPARRWPSPT